MIAIQIWDRRDRGGLGFDLKELVSVVSPLVASLRWRSEVGEVLAVNQDHAALRAEFSSGREFSGQEMLDRAARTIQIVDGIFEGRDADGAIQLKLEAVDSSFWEVSTPSPQGLAPFRESFREIREVAT